MFRILVGNKTHGDGFNNEEVDARLVNKHLRGRRLVGAER